MLHEIDPLLAPRLPAKSPAPAKKPGPFIVLLHGQIPVRFCQIPGQRVYELVGFPKASRFASEDIAVAVALRHQITQFKVTPETYPV